MIEGRGSLLPTPRVWQAGRLRLEAEGKRLEDKGEGQYIVVAQGCRAAVKLFKGQRTMDKGERFRD